MPVAKFQMPDGRVAKFEVPEGTTPEQAQAQIQAMIGGGLKEQVAPQPAADVTPTAPAKEIGIKDVLGFSPLGAAFGMGDQRETAMALAEPVATVASGMVAEPVAGISGLLAAPFVGAEEAEKTMSGVREALTYQPRTTGGQEALQAVGEFMQPVGEAISKTEKAIGDFVYEKTESPALAALATTIPAATLEAVGFGVGRKAAGVPKGIKPVVSAKKATKALVESAPDVKQIKEASRAIYNEMDNLKFTVKPEAYKSLINKVVSKAVKENVDDVLTPKSARVVQQLQSELNNPTGQTVSKLDQLRKKAQIAAQSTDPSDARLGAIMVDEIDEFLDKMPSSAFKGADIKQAGKIGERYKAARSLWGRARRAELINEAFDKAQRQATGFENGLRTQLRSILNNKKRSRFFTKDELSAMDDIVQGSGQANTLKLIGRLGFSEGAATNVLGGLVGMGVLGPAAPVLGQVSRKFAQSTTLKAAKRMESLIRGGGSGQTIAKHYLTVTPKAKRSIQDLSDMLLLSGSELDDLVKSANKTIKEAAEIAQARKTLQAAEAAGAGAAKVIQPERE